MFYGQKDLVIDEKSRVVLPSLYRGQFKGEKCFLTLGMDSCLQLYPQETFEKTAAEITSLSDFAKEARALKRTFLGNTFEIQIDSHNRILLPKALTNKVKIDKNVVLVGMFDHLEMWDKEAYEQASLTEEEAYSENASKLLGR